MHRHRGIHIEGDFDPMKCRKCQEVFENDKDDLLECSVCSLVFHGGCEEPPLKWSPTHVFCSPYCFETFEATPQGQQLFVENMMLMTGHLRKFTECMTNSDVERAVALPPVPARQGIPLWTGASPYEVRLEPGQCVSLRAQPRPDDPRIEWPAIIRHIYYHRSGVPMVIVTWMEPLKFDSDHFSYLPGGRGASVPCMSSACMVRCGEGRSPEGAVCYSATCRARSLGKKPPITHEAGLIKAPSRLRNAMSASELNKAAPGGLTKQGSVSSVSSVGGSQDDQVPPTIDTVKTEPTAVTEMVESNGNQVMKIDHGQEPTAAAFVATNAAIKQKPSEDAPMNTDVPATTHTTASLVSTSVANANTNINTNTASVIKAEPLSTSDQPAPYTATETETQAAPAAVSHNSATSAARTIATAPESVENEDVAMDDDDGHSGRTSAFSADGDGEENGRASAVSADGEDENFGRVSAVSADGDGNGGASHRTSSSEQQDEDQDQDQDQHPHHKLQDLIDEDDYDESDAGTITGDETGDDLETGTDVDTGMDTGDETGTESIYDIDTDFTVDSAAPSGQEDADETDQDDQDQDDEGKAPGEMDADGCGDAGVDSAGNESEATDTPAEVGDGSAESSSQPNQQRRSRRERASKPPPDEDDDEPPLQKQTQKTVKPAKEERKRSAKAKKKEPVKDARGGITCVCGKWFPNGRALGGHRGKCKMPRERIRDRDRDRRHQEGTSSSSNSRSKDSSQQTRPRSKRTKPASVAAKQLEKISQRQKRSQRAKTRSKNPTKKPIPRPVQLQPLYSIVPFHPNDYKIGQHEKKPQLAACIVKIHPYKFNPQDLDQEFRCKHMETAKSKFSMSVCPD